MIISSKYVIPKKIVDSKRYATKPPNFATEYQTDKTFTTPIYMEQPQRKAAHGFFSTKTYK